MQLMYMYIYMCIKHKDTYIHVKMWPEGGGGGGMCFVCGVCIMYGYCTSRTIKKKRLIM